MDPTAVAASSGLHARIAALDLIANNLANSSTTGYKMDREFYGLFAATSEIDANGNEASSQMPDMQKQWIDFSQGALQTTGGPLDLALSGQGFFVAQSPSGPLYTRGGGFRISNTGELQTPEGYPVLGKGGSAIRGLTHDPIHISTEGVVKQKNRTIGQLEVMDFQNKAALDKVGKNYFSARNPETKPTPAAKTAVEQGKIESSNVAPAESAVQLVGLMRQSEMLQKAIQVTTDMNKEVVEQVARVGG